MSCLNFCISSWVTLQGFIPFFWTAIQSFSVTAISVCFLTSIKNLFSLLDYNMINTVLVNDLEKLRKIDNSSITSAGIELIYEEIVEEVSIEVIRKKIIPSLLSILIEGNISKDTYDRITSLIQKYLDKLKKSREKVRI